MLRRPSINRSEIDKLERVNTVLQSQLNSGAGAQNFRHFLELVSSEMSWDWKHLEHIREYLRRMEEGQYKKLMIFCPPRHGKTEMTTLHFPAYLLECNPKNRVIIAAYNQILANKFSRRVRKLADRRVLLSQERSAVEEWETEAGGGIRAVGIGGGVTGQGGNWIVIDDPIKNRLDANSKVFRDRIWEWYTDDLYTRLEPNGKIILIMTRWHHDDLAGRILDSDDKDNWQVIDLAAFAKENDPLGRKQGEALCIDRYNKTDLDRIKAVIGDDSFEALYQQNPTAETGSIFKRGHFQYFKIEDVPAPEFVVQSWDTAFKTGEDNDYSVGTTWYYSKKKYYLIDRWKGRETFSVVKQAIIEKAQEYKPDVVLIEDKASGQSLVEDFKLESALPILPYKPDRDKIARAYAVTPVVDIGQVYLPQEAEWKIDFLDNLLAFPYGKHDDDVDSMTMAIRYLMQKYAYNLMSVTDDFDYAAFNQTIKY